MKLKNLLKYKFTYVVIGAFITGVVTYFFNVRLMEREYFYKTKSEKQKFASELSQMLQKRIYNSEVFIWNVKNDATKDTILESWENCKNITLDWNEKLPDYYLRLDIYLPPSQFIIKNYSNYLENKLSFRDFLLKEIQLEIIPIHEQLVELKKSIIKDERVNQDLLAALEKSMIKLHVKIAHYCEALYKALND